VSARRSTRRAPSATSAPASASARAIGTPMPEEAPVTMATRPSSRKESRTVGGAEEDMRESMSAEVRG
jgi:hypothetical protein